MKKVFILFVFSINFSFGQAITLTPNVLQKNGTSNSFADLEVRKYSEIPLIMGQVANGTPNLPTNLNSGFHLLRLGGSGYVNGSFTSSRTQINFLTAENWANLSHGTKITFATTSNGTITPFSRMTIDHSGYVGIGLDPSAKLHIGGTETEKLRLENTLPLALGVNSEMYFKTGTYFTGAIKTIGTASQSARIGFFTFSGTNSQDLVERLSIADGGNVGIGITNPAEKLHVVGTTKLEGPTVIGTTGTQLQSVSRVLFLHNIPNVIANTFYSFQIPLTNPISTGDGLFVNASGNLGTLQICWVSKNGSNVEVKMYNAGFNDFDPNNMEFYLTIINWN